MRVALLHDWLTGMRGGEKCLEALCRVYPRADLYTLFCRPGSISPLIRNRSIHTSFLQRLSGLVGNYRYLLPLMPLAAEKLRIPPRYDVVVSLSHAVVKSVVAPPGVPHVCYCFTPMRYAWHLYEDYFERQDLADGPDRPAKRPAPGDRLGSLATSVRRAFFARLRRWDRDTANRVSHFVAISREVQQRIGDCYGRASTVIYPPIDANYFTPTDTPREDYYLCVSALVPYKRVDLAVRACQQLGRRLVVIGAGPEETQVRRLAGPNVQMLGWQPDSVVRDHLRRCRALLFPGREDFGLVPVEAQACGAPVVAFGVGGVLDSLLPASDGQRGTAVLFARQTVDALAEAIARLERHPQRISAKLARRNAERFRAERFEDCFRSYVDSVLSGRQPHGPAETSSRRLNGRGTETRPQEVTGRDGSEKMQGGRAVVVRS